MKKLGIGVFVLALVAGLTMVVSDHYRYELYDAAMSFESEKAQLSLKSGRFDATDFAYLEGPKREGQETIMMLHGFSANKYNWLRFAGQLSDDYHVIALDLAGHGDNAADMNRSYSIVQQAEFVHKASRAIGISRFHVVGNSMGGAISALYSATYPKDVITATLISPAGVHDVPSKMDELLEQGENPLIASTTDEFLAVMDFVMVEKPYIPGPIAKVEAEKAVLREPLNKKIFADIRADMELGLNSRFAQIKAPVLLIWGDQDRAINYKNIDKYAQLIPNAQKEIYANIGHLAMIEVPERTANSWRSFVSAQTQVKPTQVK